MMKDIVLLFSDNTWEFCSEPLIDKVCKEHKWKGNYIDTKSVLIVYFSKTEYRNLSEEEEIYSLHKNFIQKRH